ncbi:MAG: peptidylprolyl isomerase, partial [bacterium]
MKKHNPAVMIALLVLMLSIPVSAQTVDPGTSGHTLVDRVLATVNDEIILESEVLQFVQDIILRNRSMYSSPEQITALSNQILNELINQKILLAIAEEDTNIKVEDREIDQTLDQRINQIVQELGSEEALALYYGKPIRQIRREFRKQVRDNLKIDRLRSRKLQSVSVNKSEVEDYFQLNRDQLPTLPERFHLAHILVQIQPTEEATKRAKALADSLFRVLMTSGNFEDLAMKYSDDRSTGAKGGLLGTTQRGDLVPEYESVAFGLNEGEISEPIRSRFGFHIIRLNWRRGEKINSSHILISLRPTDADGDRAVEKASGLYTRIQNGEDFATLAKEYSDDKDNASQGGDLGWFDVNQLRPDFKNVVTTLDSGEVSQPFRTQLGIHLLKLLAKEPERPLDLKNDWDRISRLAQVEKQEQVYNRWVEDLKKNVYI